MQVFYILFINYYKTAKSLLVQLFLDFFSKASFTMLKTLSLKLFPFILLGIF